MNRSKLGHIFIGCVILLFWGCNSISEQEDNFLNPPEKFKPMPFWHINGELTSEGIKKQIRDAKELGGFSGIGVLPLSERNAKKPGTSPTFLSPEYMNKYAEVLEILAELDMQAILYDDIDFPSGMAGGKMQENHPNHTRKRLDKTEIEIKGPNLYSDSIFEGKLMSVVAMNTATQESQELSKFVNNRMIRWEVPEGNWKIMHFNLVKDTCHKKYLITDHLDPEAVEHFIDLTYNAYAERFSSYFGNTIQLTFFDDVGFWKHPRTWTGKFNEKFEELNGFDPKPYYPCLWYDIGPNTEALRHAFFKTRAELLAEGFPRLVAAWAKEHGLKDTGHPPGNYDPTPIDMNGDIFKFFRYTAVPLTDAIIDYQFGQNGHKLISSAADYYDRPVVATEIYGAYKENIMDSLMLYRSMMDLFARGVNFVVPHGLWYNSDPKTIHISPLVSPYSEKLARALPAYSDYVGRSCMLLQGGRRVADIGVIYPFESLAAWYHFDAEDMKRQGFYVSPETDYQKISSFLSNEIRRDFTFVHPEFLLDDKYTIEDGTIQLNNSENYQEYKTIFITGSSIISYKTLEKLKLFYDNGGMLISTTQLPSKAAEIGQDQKVIDIIESIFGINPMQQTQVNEIRRTSNDNGGQAIFVPEISVDLLQQVLNTHSPDPDVQFLSNPKLGNDFGKFNYIHKVKDGLDIFFFSNSSNETIETEVLLRGQLVLQKLNPHSGAVSKNVIHEYVKKEGETFTKIKLTLKPVSSLFYISAK